VKVRIRDIVGDSVAGGAFKWRTWISEHIDRKEMKQEPKMKRAKGMFNQIKKHEIGTVTTDTRTYTASR
jgi:hypothetical protein